MRQIEAASFEGMENEFVMQVDTTFMKGGSGFERIVRVEMTENGLVEIYTESSENIRGKEEDYFKKKWVRFEERLRKDGIMRKM